MSKLNGNTNKYKQTSLGLLPNDWEVKNVRDVCIKFLNGGTPSTLVEEYWTGKIPWITGADINEQRISGIRRFISEKAVKESSTNIIPKGYLLLATRTGVGKVIVAPFDVAISQDLTGLLLNQKLIDTEYAFYFFDGIERKLKQLNQGTSINGITRDVLETLNLPLPSLLEQKAIAHILSLMDKAISNNKKLIAQKELRKKWLMQNLLTGKKRLKGFSGEWKEERLGKLFKEIKNVNDGGGSHSIMTISSKLGLISQEDKFDRVIAGDSLKKYTQLTRDDFAYNKGNSKTYPMGCIYQLEKNETALVPFVYICFSPTKLIDAKFYKHWFLAHGVDRQLKKIITSGARGDGLLNVNTDDFFSLKIVCPPIAEQTAIAQVLQTVDKEIQLLKAKAERLKEQKKGMMQVLLTGRKRLKV